MRLTGKQERFCREYMIDFNATQAAIRSGYSKKTAGSIGQENLTKPEIFKRIELLQEELRNKAELTAEMIIEELRALCFYNIQDFVDTGNSIKDITKLSRKLTRPITGIKVTESFTKNASGKMDKEVTTELKFTDKRGALVDLGRHLGIFEKDNEQGKTIIKVTRK